MKKHFNLFIIAAIMACLNIHPLSAQVAINKDNSDSDSSAMLDVKSTDKGILIPRMTTSQRTNISNPAKGLLVFDNDTNGFWYYDGNNWLSLLTNSDNQTLSLNSNTLSLDNGGSVDLSNFLDNTDNQDLSLSDNTLSLTGDGTTVDLSNFLDNTDNQDLSISGNTLSLTGDGTTVDLSNFLDNTDNQDLSLSGNTLSLTGDGTGVDLSSYLDNTDNQDLSLSGNTLSLTGDGTTVDLSAYLNADDLGNHTATQNIQLNGNYFSNDGDNEGISIGNNGGLTVQSSFLNNRPALFSSAKNGGVYIEVNNSIGTRALFGPDGNGLGVGSTSDVVIGNWSNGGLNFYTNATKRVNISNTGQFEILGDLKYANGSQGLGKVLVSDANGLASWSTIPPATLLEDADNDTKIQLLETPGEDIILFNVSGNQVARMGENGVLFTNGKIGIGHSNPTEDLYVGGDQRVLGKLATNSLQVTTGLNAGEGHALKTDAGGDVYLEDPADRIVYTFDEIVHTAVTNGLTGWIGVSTSTPVLSVSPDDVITVRISFSAKLHGGSGSDVLRFRAAANGQASGCPDIVGGTTSDLEVYREVRNHSVQTFIQYTFAANCNGTYEFVLEADRTDTDDNLVIDNVQITAVKY